MGTLSVAVGTTAVGSPSMKGCAMLDSSHKTAQEEVVSWVECAMDLGLEGELFPSPGELQVVVDSFHSS